MTRDEFVQKTYLTAMRKSTPPDENTEKWKNIVDIGNILIEEWQDEPNTDWNSLKRSGEENLLTPTDRVQINPSVVRKVSDKPGDYIEVKNGDYSQKYYYVAPEKLKESPRYVTREEDYLVFSEPFDADSPLIGGKVYFKYFTYANKLTDSNSRVPVDQPMWLVYSTAAEFARNDYIKQGQYGNIVAKATNLMNSMKLNNGAYQQKTVPKNFVPLGETF